MNSRYYNPEWGRFISPDSYLNANGDLIGFNLYAYCSNEPIIGSDYSGSKKEFDKSLLGAYKGAYLIIDYSVIPFVGHALILYEKKGVWYKTQVYGSDFAIKAGIIYSVVNIFQTDYYLKTRNFRGAVFSITQVGTTVAEIINEPISNNDIEAALNTSLTNGSDVIGLYGDYSYIYDEAPKEASYCYYNLFYNNCAHYIESLLWKYPSKKYNNLGRYLIPKSLGEALK